MQYPSFAGYIFPFDSAQIELFCEATPKACENFLAHCAAGTYNGVKMHRNIAGFMVQTGDPTGTGKGGQSIWGNPFPDEIRATLKVCMSVSRGCEMLAVMAALLLPSSALVLRIRARRYGCTAGRSRYVLEPG